MIMIGYIYLIIDLLTGKKYVGQHHYHKPELDPNYHGSGRIIKRLYKKRPETLKMEYIKTCYSQEELDEWEKYFIFVYDTLYPNGYNLRDGGDGKLFSDETKKKLSESHKGKPSGKKGKKASNETRRKLSESHKGKPSPKKGKSGKKHTDETKKKMSESARGRKISDEIKKKMSESARGRSFSDESRKKMSESHKGKHLSEEHKRKISEASKRRWNKQKNQQDECVPLW